MDRQARTDDTLGLTSQGLFVVCETCESDLDFADDFSDTGVCRQCGIAFLIDDGRATPVDRAADRSAHVS